MEALNRAGRTASLITLAVTLQVPLSSIVNATPRVSRSSPLTRVIVGDRLAYLNALQPGTRRYIRYLVAADGQRKLVDLWQRRIEKAALPGGSAGFHMTQRWDEARDGSILIQDSWLKAETLEPVSHIRRMVKDGTTTLKGYRFTVDAVVAMTDLPGATNSSFHMPLSERSFNFEYDMELFEALPLAPGRIFDIPFYDAGIDKAPARYRFAVAGTAAIIGWDGRPVDCWVLTGDYNTGKIMNRFWITKVGHVLVREEGPGWDGAILVKALLPPENETAA